jgi:hypothetical protein
MRITITINSIPGQGQPQFNTMRMGANITMW